jgi:hypothetical protein
MDKAEAINWKSELQELVASSDAKDRGAVEAFSKAIGPYLDNPELLRTLLGKIQRYAEIQSVQVVTESRVSL